MSPRREPAGVGAGVEDQVVDVRSSVLVTSMTSRSPAGTSIAAGWKRMPLAVTATVVVCPVAGTPRRRRHRAAAPVGLRAAATPTSTASRTSARPAATPPSGRGALGRRRGA